MNKEELRDRYAELVMTSFIGKPDITVGEEKFTLPKHAEILAECSYKVADAMLAAREVKHD